MRKVSFCPVVHSQLLINHRSGKDAEFQTITTPNALQELDATISTGSSRPTSSCPFPFPVRTAAFGPQSDYSASKPPACCSRTSPLWQKSPPLPVSLGRARPDLRAPADRGHAAATGGGGKQLLKIGLKGGFPACTGWFFHLPVHSSSSEYGPGPTCCSVSTPRPGSSPEPISPSGKLHTSSAPP